MMIITFALVNAFVAVDVLPLKMEAVVQAPSTVSTLDEHNPSYIYRLTNPSKTAYIISRVEASCGCLATTLSSEEGKSPVPAAPLILPVTLAPGQSVAVRATVRLSDLRPGPFHKTVTIWGRLADAPTPANTNDAIALSQAESLARIVMEGTLAQPVLFARESDKQAVPLSAAPVAFGRVSAGAVRQEAADKQALPGEFILLATPDPRLLGKRTTIEIPPLTSSHPSITVTPLPDAVSATKQDLRTLRYQVRVTDKAPLGPFLANLSFKPVGRGKSSEVELRQDQAWRTASLLVTGEVVGELSASPSLVTFVLSTPRSVAPSGSVTSPTTAPVNALPDKNLTRQIVLTAVRPDVFAGLTVSTDNALVKAVVNPPVATTGSDVNRCLLTVTLSPEIYQASFTPSSVAPLQGSTFGRASQAGNTLHSRITLSLPNGQQIVIPVSVYRSAPTK